MRMGMRLRTGHAELTANQGSSRKGRRNGFVLPRHLTLDCGGRCRKLRAVSRFVRRAQARRVQGTIAVHQPHL